MQAVVLYPPSHDIRVETVPLPVIEEPDDAIVKISLSGLCGSDLHSYRGVAPFENAFVMGHEFVGEVTALGSAYTNPTASTRPGLYGSLKVGDHVVSPFSTSCGECQFCRVGFTSRCAHSQLFGSQSLPGAQAQYVRVPHAGGTLFLAPTVGDGKASDASLLLLADILPTGYFAALQALSHANIRPFLEDEVFLNNGLAIASSDRHAAETITFAVVGLGPVGLCALVSLFDILSARTSALQFRVVAVDLNPERRAKAQKVLEKLGVYGKLGFVAAPEEAKAMLSSFGAEFGAHAVIEVVGNNSALVLSYDLIRPFGVISSVGVHSHQPFPLHGESLYNKNVSLIFGRCPVRTLFPRALELLGRRQDVFGLVGDEAGLIDRIVGMSDAEAKGAYEDFESGRCGKVLFDPWRV